MPPSPVLGLGGLPFYRHNAQIHTSYTVCCLFVRNLKESDGKTGVSGRLAGSGCFGMAGDSPPVGDSGRAAGAGLSNSATFKQKSHFKNSAKTKKTAFSATQLLTYCNAHCII